MRTAGKRRRGRVKCKDEEKNRRRKWGERKKITLVKEDRMCRKRRRNGDAFMLNDTPDS